MRQESGSKLGNPAALAARSASSRNISGIGGPNQRDRSGTPCERLSIQRVRNSSSPQTFGVIICLNGTISAISLTVATMESALAWPTNPRKSIAPLLMFPSPSRRYHSRDRPSFRYLVLFSVVKDDSHRASMPRAKPAYAVTKVNSIRPARSLHRAMMDRENHAVSLL
jgi:hypothetical protein